MEVYISEYKKSIYDLGLDKDSETILWDFYVTKAICNSASQKRTPSDYGLKKIPYERMLEVAGITPLNAVPLLANTMPKTLERLGLNTTEGKGKDKREIGIETTPCRFAFITPYTISDNDIPKGNCGKGESLLTHVRNAFAHGNTYFFKDGTMLLEDKDQRGNITARIIIKVETLFAWIKLIDKNEKYYHIYGLNKNSDR